MLKKINRAYTVKREDLKTAVQENAAAAERLRRACLPEGYCPMLPSQPGGRRP